MSIALVFLLTLLSLNTVSFAQTSTGCGDGGRAPCPAFVESIPCDNFDTDEQGVRRCDFGPRSVETPGRRPPTLSYFSSCAAPINEAISTLSNSQARQPRPLTANYFPANSTQAYIMRPLEVRSFANDERNAFTNSHPYLAGRGPILIAALPLQDSVTHTIDQTVNIEMSVRGHGSRQHCEVEGVRFANLYLTRRNCEYLALTLEPCTPGARPDGHTMCYQDYANLRRYRGSCVYIHSPTLNPPNQEACFLDETSTTHNQSPTQRTLFIQNKFQQAQRICRTLFRDSFSQRPTREFHQPASGNSAR